MSVDVFGDQAPVHYLSCWLSHSGDMSFAQHKKYYPTIGDIRRYLEKINAAAFDVTGLGTLLVNN